ncbi:MAG: dCMP deaminase family protein [Turicibacter sp.]|nr:dCMP deaminase family protein [Turicibacter sp.]
MHKDYISWDEYFMSVANLSSLRSKDPSTRVGSCIVNARNHIIGVGYNGFPVGISDEDFPWEREGDFLETKYPYVVHAEQNAILNAHGSVYGCRIYTSNFPCHECAKYIIQAGIKEVIYMRERGSDDNSKTAAKRMFQAAGVTYRKMEALEITVRRLEGFDL